MNGGLCTINYSVYPTYYQCSCLNGYSGTNCQTMTSTTCVDTNSVSCQIYAASNFCSNMYSYNGIAIPTYCPKSCNMCSSSTVTAAPATCTDLSTSCSSWVASNYCNLYPVYALCKRSCNLC